MKRMGLFSKSRLAAFSHFFSRIPRGEKPKKNSIYFLNLSQFCGVLNDNIFKLVIAFLLIDIQGQKSASSILASAGTIFVIPFLLFSSAAGVLADRFSKQRLLISMKVVEMCIMLLAMLAFAVKSVWASYTLLFLLSTHSAMFGPSKYAIISELVPPDRVSRANGLITSFTYLGIIFGTFFASFITEMTDKNFVIVAGFCFLIAVAGFFSTFGIQYTPPQGSQKKINPFFLQEIWETLKFTASRKHLLVAVLGSAYFLFIGAFTQLNIIPFAIQSLHLSEIAGPYLFLSTALGIAFGSHLAGKASKVRVELGLPCLSGFVISFLLFLLSLFSSNIVIVIMLLILLGIFGGFFIVPLDTFVQIYSPNEKRGQVIATNNFLSFFGVLIAAFALFFYSEVLEISSASGFSVTGLITLVLSFLMLSLLSDLAIPYISRKLLKPFFKPRIENLEILERNPGAVIVLKRANWTKACLLSIYAQKIHFLIPRIKKRRFPWFNWVFYSIHIIPSDETYSALLKAAKDLASDSINPCIFVESDPLPETLEPASKLVSFFKFGAEQLIYADVNFASPVTTITFSKR